MVAQTGQALAQNLADLGCASLLSRLALFA